MSVLTFLQEVLDGGRAPSTLKVYVASITANRTSMASQSIGKHDLVVQFLRGARRLNPPRPCSVPFILGTSPLCSGLSEGPPFDPLESANLRPLSLKTALLLALASVKQVGDLQAPSVETSCQEFGPNDSKVVLRPRKG